MTRLIFLLATSCHAEMTVQPKAETAQIIAQILPDAVSVSSFCDANACLIEWTNRPGKTATFTDHAYARQALLDELSTMEIKIDSGSSLTEAELRRYIKIMLKISRLARRP